MLNVRVTTGRPAALGCPAEAMPPQPPAAEAPAVFERIDGVPPDAGEALRSAPLAGARPPRAGAAASPHGAGPPGPLPLVNDALARLPAYVPGVSAAATERQLGVRNALKLSSNESRLGPSPRVQPAIAAALPHLHLYPDTDADTLRARLAGAHGVAPEQVVVGNGSGELIDVIVRAFVRPGETLLYADPSYSAYRLAAAAAGHSSVAVPLRAGVCDLAGLARAADARTKVLFLANPNNPTGTYVTAAALRQMFAALPASTIVVLDEAYGDFACAPDFPDGIALLPARQRLVILRTFSKAHGLAALRLGYAVAAPELAAALRRGRQPFSVNALAQVAALASLGDPEHLARTRAVNHAQRQALGDALTARGLAVMPSQANFVTVDLGRDAAAAFAALQRQGVIVRPLDDYGMPTSLRVTVGTAADTARFLAALDAVGL